jgi:tripartite-type tricarboxylate transporter receptor subunit TctC
MASAGPGSQSHLAGTMFQLAGDFTSVHVPYKGGGPSVASVMSGESQWTLTPASAVAGPVRSGRLRALAQSLPQRTPLLEGVPSLAETLPGFSYSAWVGVLVPKGTPKQVADKLRAALLKTMALPEVKEGFGKQGAEVSTDTPEEFREMVRAEIENMRKVVKAADLKIE